MGVAGQAWQFLAEAALVVARFGEQRDVTGVRVQGQGVGAVQGVALVVAGGQRQGVHQPLEACQQRGAVAGLGAGRAGVFGQQRGFGVFALGQPGAAGQVILEAGKAQLQLPCFVILPPHAAVAAQVQQGVVVAAVVEHHEAGQGLVDAAEVQRVARQVRVDQVVEVGLGEIRIDRRGNRGSNRQRIEA
ncbi:hypothetical protein D3C71_1363230 [compost metagenome]